MNAYDYMLDDPTADAREQQDLEQEWLEEVVAYECPYCSALYSLERSDCDGTDILCCAELHCTPYTREQQMHDEKNRNEWERISKQEQLQ